MATRQAMDGIWTSLERPRPRPLTGEQLYETVTRHSRLVQALQSAHRAEVTSLLIVERALQSELIANWNISSKINNRTFSLLLMTSLYAEEYYLIFRYHSLSFNERISVSGVFRSYGGLCCNHYSSLAVS